jgi:hypothetical protein
MVVVTVVPATIVQKPYIDCVTLLNMVRVWVSKEVAVRVMAVVVLFVTSV